MAPLHNPLVAPYGFPSTIPPLPSTDGLDPVVRASVRTEALGSLELDGTTAHGVAVVIRLSCVAPGVVRAQLGNDPGGVKLARRPTDPSTWTVERPEPGRVRLVANDVTVEVELEPWAGDPNCTYQDLASTMRGGLSLGASGHPFWSHDIGGFHGQPTPDLYVRWAQFGLLSPLSRLHGMTTRLPWDFGEGVPADAVAHDGTTGERLHNLYTLVYWDFVTVDAYLLESGQATLLDLDGATQVSASLDGTRLEVRLSGAKSRVGLRLLPVANRAVEEVRLNGTRLPKTAWTMQSDNALGALLVASVRA